MADIFVSYTSSDRDWAFWIGQELVRLKHSPRIHEWEIQAGGDIPAWMEKRLQKADCVLCVFSAAYLTKDFSNWERRSAHWAAASTRPNFMLPVFVEDLDPPVALAHIKRCGLYGLGENDARARLEAYLAQAKPPATPVRFPGGAKAPPAPAKQAQTTPFPGAKFAAPNDVREGIDKSYPQVWAFSRAWANRVRKNAPAYIPLPILIAVAIIVIALHALFKPDSIAEGKRYFRETVEKVEKLGPLFSYYLDDTFGELAVQSTLLIPNVEDQSKTITVPFTIFFDVPSNVYVASVYVPPIDNLNVFNGTMTQIATKYRASFEEFLKKIHLTESPPDQPDWLSDTANSSNRIYLYYENFVSQDDLAKFRLLFSQNGANVEFRGPSYLRYKEGVK